MSFPTYDAYKESGTEWIGQVPTHWNAWPYKRIVDIQNGSDHKHIEQDEGYPVIGSGGVFAYASGFMYDGESVLLGRKGTIDKPLYVSGKFWTVDTMYWTKISPDACGRFAYYSALTIPFDLYSTNTALPSMTKGALHAHRIAVPPLEEQITIATFLDAETSKIDGLVAQQRRLIELLREKRQAVISHAVTKGLNPNAPTKPSGIQWLGDVPEHWEVVPLKYLVSIRGGGTPSKANLAYWEDGDVPWASSKDLKVESLGDTIDHITQHAINDNSADLVEAGSLLVVVRGMILAHTFPVVKALVPMAINQDLKALMPSDRLHEDYLCWGLRGSALETLGRVDEAAHGTKVLRMDSWLAMLFPVPPLDEQIEITKAIIENAERFRMLITEAEQAVELLQERRTALISAAVTGKIDVREYSPQEAT